MSPKDRIELLRKTAILMSVEGAPVCRSLAVNNAADEISKMEKALEMARLLCANLDNGGHGHATLVNAFRDLDG